MLEQYNNQPTVLGVYMILNITEYSEEPLHNQIAQQIWEKIQSGIINPGEALPSVRTLARTYHISIPAVNRAYANLVRAGIIQFYSKNAYFVTSLHNNSVAPTISQQYKEFTEKKRLKEELRGAAQILNDLLPQKLPKNDNFEISAYLEPSCTIGGDFYDFFSIDDTLFSIVIADACGKGIPAALLISQVQAILKIEAVGNGHIETTMKHLNSHIIRHTSAQNYITLFYGIFNVNTGILHYSNAGHHFPILLRTGGTFEMLPSTSLALGFIENEDFSHKSIQINKGDILLLYSDGVTDGHNSSGEEFGETRLKEILLKNNSKDTEEIVAALTAEIKQFNTISAFSDDKTIVVFKRIERSINFNKLKL